MNWWQRLRRRPQLERELDAELQDHFDRQVHDNIRAGMSEAEARRRARLGFGGADGVKEACRDARGTRWVEDIAHDARFAVRLLAKERWFTLAAVAALALGLGVGAMIITIMNAYDFRGLPVAPDRILSVGTRDAAGRERGLSYLELQDWRESARSFSALAAFGTAMMTISDEGQAPDRVAGAYISANGFRVLGVAPFLGRDFAADDDRPGAPGVVILGHRLWASRYGADVNAVGRTVKVAGVPAVVIGVMPEGFGFPFLQTLWQPLASMPALTGQPRDARTLDVFGRLADGVSADEARAELAAIAARQSLEYPQTNTGVQATAVRFGEQQVGRLEAAPGPLMVIATALFVLLIACANVANLLLARAAGRSREISIRASVGATRWRIVRAAPRRKRAPRIGRRSARPLAVHVRRRRRGRDSSKATSRTGSSPAWTAGSWRCSRPCAVWRACLRAGSGALPVEDRRQRRAEGGRTDRDRPARAPLDERAARGGAHADARPARRRRPDAAQLSRHVQRRSLHRHVAGADHGAGLAGSQVPDTRAAARVLRAAAGSARQGSGDRRGQPGESPPVRGSGGSAAVDRRTACGSRRTAAESVGRRDRSTLLRDAGPAPPPGKGAHEPRRHAGPRERDREPAVRGHVFPARGSDRSADPVERSGGRRRPGPVAHDCRRVADRASERAAGGWTSGRMRPIGPRQGRPPR